MTRQGLSFSAHSRCTARGGGAGQHTAAGAGPATILRGGGDLGIAEQRRADQWRGPRSSDVGITGNAPAAPVDCIGWGCCRRHAAYDRMKQITAAETKIASQV